MQRVISEQELLDNLGWVRALARRLVDGDADDLVQQVCVAALDRGQIRVVGSAGAGPRVRAWLARATVFLANNHRRGEARRRERERVHARTEVLPSAHDVVARSGLVLRIVQAVDQLDEPYRTTVLLRYLDQMPTPLISDTMEVGHALVRKRLSRGLAQLREQLGRQGLDQRALSALAPLPVALASTSSSATSTVAAITMGTTFTKLVVGSAVAGVATLAYVKSASDDLSELTPAEVAGDRGANIAALNSSKPAALVEPVAVAAPQRREAIAPKGERVKVSATDRNLPREKTLTPTHAEYDALLAVEEWLKSNAPTLAVADRPDEGYHVEYYDGGARKAAGMILDGSRDGDWTEWHESGEVMARGNCFAGMRHGAWLYWNVEGIEIRRSPYDYGRVEGTLEELCDGLRVVSEHRNGVKHGRTRHTDAEGQLLLDALWFLGKHHGESRTYHANGVLASQGRYVHGKKSGDWRYWNVAGELDTERSGTVETPIRQEVYPEELLTLLEAVYAVPTSSTAVPSR